MARTAYMKAIALAAAGALFAGALAHAAGGDASVAAGQALWNKLQANEVQCGALASGDFINLGDYFMDQMMGGAHEAMDQAVAARSGQAGLDAMHLAMGERFSGCNPDAAFPAGSGMMGGWGYGAPMMGPWGYYDYGGSKATGAAPEAAAASSGVWSAPQNHPYYGMMGYGYGYGPMMGGWGYENPLGWIFMVLFWAVLAACAALCVLWIVRRAKGGRGGGKSALEILKERYAKGEIDRREFEEKKKDLEA